MVSKFYFIGKFGETRYEHVTEKQVTKTGNESLNKQTGTKITNSYTWLNVFRQRAAHDAAPEIPRAMKKATFPRTALIMIDYDRRLSDETLRGTRAPPNNRN
ncbi:hypothetical protein EVAR_58807_1 [Eumeta japonica]|uniref:Uncharacterized protein n=1 Tax=Eumeta variegata TaxID=151549 RepID=A0A4C1YL56_EUMVA|nr:hypothetical protein EVAR_58807_1 [Eumeta japonica]